LQWAECGLTSSKVIADHTVTMKLKVVVDPAVGGEETLCMAT
jgi:hypothetical protein